MGSSLLCGIQYQKRGLSVKRVTDLVISWGLGVCSPKKIKGPINSVSCSETRKGLVREEKNRVPEFKIQS